MDRTAGRMPFAFAVIATAITIGAFDELSCIRRASATTALRPKLTLRRHGNHSVRGKRAVKRLPLPGSLSISSFAWCRNRACFTIAKS